MNWHKFATVALGIGSFVAAKFIPAAAVITLGPVGIPVAGLVTAGLAIAAAVGVVPAQVSPTVANLIAGISVKKN